MTLTHRLAAGMLAGSLILTGAGSTFAAAAKPAPKLTFATGQVSNLAANGFTLTPVAKKAKKNPSTTAPAATSVTIAIDAKTKLAARKGETASLANGDYALVVGTKSTTGITARRVLFSTKPFNGNKAGRRIVAASTIHRAAGAVTTTTATSLTIQTKAGKTLTFTIAPKARYLVNGQLAQTAPTFTAGEQVRVRYVKNQKGLIARVIAVGTKAAAQQ